MRDCIVWPFVMEMNMLHTHADYGTVFSLMQRVLFDCDSDPTAVSSLYHAISRGTQSDAIDRMIAFYNDKDSDDATGFSTVGCCSN